MKNSILTRSSIVIAFLISLGSCAPNKDLAVLKQNYQAQQSTLELCQQQNESIDSGLMLIGDKNTKLQKENEELKSKLMIAGETIKEITKQNPERSKEMEKGLVFRVQIGAYEKRNLAKNLTISENIDTEEQDNLQKIVVGQFRDYLKAKKLKEQLREMGVSDAFIVSYRDGKRVPLNTVLLELEIEK